MIKRLLSHHWMAAAAALWLVPALAAGSAGDSAGDSAGGALQVQTDLPDMVQKGWPYRIALTPAVSAPANGRLTDITWHYELTPGAVMPDVRLCTPSSCVALAMARGRTDALAGLAADTPLSLRVVLPGEGMLKRPVSGGTAQVFIHYRRTD